MAAGFSQDENGLEAKPSSKTCISIRYRKTFNKIYLGNFR